MKISRLIQIDFDTMENRSAEAMCEKQLGVFQDDDKIMAHGKIARWFDGKKFALYLGWNGQVYPQFRIEESQVQ